MMPTLGIGGRDDGCIDDLVETLEHVEPLALGFRGRIAKRDIRQSGLSGRLARGESPDEAASEPMGRNAAFAE